MVFKENLIERLEKEISVLKICLVFCSGKEYKECKGDICIRRRIIIKLLLQ